MTLNIGVATTWHANLLSLLLMALDVGDNWADGLFWQIKTI